MPFRCILGISSSSKLLLHSIASGSASVSAPCLSTIEGILSGPAEVLFLLLLRALLNLSIVISMVSMHGVGGVSREGGNASGSVKTDSY